jgi:dTDP-4-dehydrorhamnose reductase
MRATVARLSELYGATMVYISTAGVFDGKKAEPYTEEDSPNPIMIYGSTKYKGELLTQLHCKRSYVVRAGWMMGGGRNNEKKFIYKILKQLEDGKQAIHAVDDRWGTPTYTYDFAQNLFCLLETGWYGTYHMVCEGSGTRYDVANEIMNACNRNDVSLTAVTSDFFKDTYFAPRPVSEIMCNAALDKRGINHMRNWKISLKDYLRTFFADFITGTTTINAEHRVEGRKNVHLPLLYQQHGHKTEASLCGAIATDMSRLGIGIVTEKKLTAGQKILFTHKQLATKSIPAVIQWAEPIGVRTKAGLSVMDSSLIWNMT